MIRLKLFLIPAFTVFLTTACSIFSDQPQEEDLGPANISLPVLEKKMKQATDPKGVFKNADSYIMKQLLVTDKEGDKDVFMIITRFKKPNKLSIMKLEKGIPISGQIINGDKAWHIDYEEKKIIPLTGRDLKLAQVLFEIGNPSATLSQIFPEIKLQQCRIDAKQFYKLTCSAGQEGFSPLTIYVGKGNFLVKQVSFVRKQDGLKYKAIMDKYDLYEGVMVAKQLTVKLDDLVQNYKITEYKLNAKLDKQDFDPPDFKNMEL